MVHERIWKKFSYMGANFRISSSEYDVICEEIVRQRTILSSYIEKHQDFMESMVPVSIEADAPYCKKDAQGITSYRDRTHGCCCRGKCPDSS